MDIQLDQGLIADDLEAVDLAGFDHQNVAGSCLELFPIDVVSAPTGLDELDLIIWVPVWPRSFPCCSVEEKNRDVHVSVVGSNEIV